jgi:malonate decarboxylase alpha subunit
MKRASLKVPPVMIYGDAVTQVVSESGIAHLHKCATLQEREAAIKAIAGDTDLGREAKPEQTTDLRRRKVVQTVEDLEINRAEANASLLAAQSMDDLVKWSGGLYKVPKRFLNTG